MKIEELKVNNIVFAQLGERRKPCLIKGIKSDYVEALFICENKNEFEDEFKQIPLKDLQPIELMESTLYVLGLKKGYYGHPHNTCYLLTHNGVGLLIVVRNVTGVWSAMEFDAKGNTSLVPIQLHTLQNLMQDMGCSPININADMFIELTRPFCILPFVPNQNNKM